MCGVSACVHVGVGACECEDKNVAYLCIGIGELLGYYCVGRPFQRIPLSEALTLTLSTQRC